MGEKRFELPLKLCIEIRSENMEEYWKNGIVENKINKWVQCIMEVNFDYFIFYLVKLLLLTFLIFNHPIRLFSFITYNWNFCKTLWASACGNSFHFKRYFHASSMCFSSGTRFLSADQILPQSLGNSHFSLFS
jgi:hypothetical protein